MSVKLSEVMKDLLDVELTDQLSYTIELTDLETKQRFEKKKLESVSESVYYAFVVLPFIVTSWMLLRLHWLGVLVGVAVTAVATIVWNRTFKTKEGKLRQRHKDEIKELEAKYNL